jgi:NADH-quinone oxidoreductase subunit J
MAFPGAELLVGLIFAVFVALTAVGALLAVFTTRVIRSVSGLAVCSVGLAGLFYFLHSPFLALMEILIYVGAVCVTIVFAIMLAEPEDQTTGEPRRPSSWILSGFGVAVSGTIFWSLWRLGNQTPWDRIAPPANNGSVEEIGYALLTTYSLAFELISLALLVAILGALVIARSGRSLPSELEAPAAPLKPSQPRPPRAEAPEQPAVPARETVSAHP